MAVSVQWVTAELENNRNVTVGLSEPLINCLFWTFGMSDLEAAIKVLEQHQVYSVFFLLFILPPQRQSVGDCDFVSVVCWQNIS